MQCVLSTFTSLNFPVLVGQTFVLSNSILLMSHYLFDYPANVILLCHKLNFHLVNFRLGNFKVYAVALGVRVPSLRRRRRYPLRP